MGIDFLDLVFRLEKSFKHPFDTTTLVSPEKQIQGGSITAADILEWVRDTLFASGTPVPPDAWERVRWCISSTVSLAPSTVSPTSRLVEDLGFA